MLKHAQLIIALLLSSISITACGKGTSTPPPIRVWDAIEALKVQEEKLLEELKPLLKEDEAEEKIYQLKSLSYLYSYKDKAVKKIVKKGIPFQDKIKSITNELEDRKKLNNDTGHKYFKDGKVIAGLEKELELYKIFKKKLDLDFGLIKPEQA